ncbi:MAG: FAD-dependent oxidoreductase [Ruminococcaceae bacterium]|nr:FAD-dependent oxidoreductase [Oscillospiraceae bacterium]
MIFKIECPVEERYDLVVCGGGPAGFSAAISAARNGVRVALVEQMGYLGGTATVNGVNVFSWGYHDGTRLVTGGMFMEIYNELLSRDALIPHWHYGWEPFDMEAYKLLLDEKVKEAGVDVYLESSVVSVAMEEKRITHIMLNTIKGAIALEAKQFIDATGDGHLAMLAGVPFEIGRESDGAIQPYTMMFFVGGVDFDVIKNYNRRGMWKTEDNRTYVNGNGFREFIEKANADGLDFIPKKTIGSMYNIPWLPGVCGINFGRVFADRTLDPRRLFDDTAIGRKQVQEGVEILKKYIPGFENCYLLETSPKIGRRESRRIKGLYTMTSEDVRVQRQFDDVIAQACYQIDIHNPTDSGSTIVRVPEGSHYDIPFRSLVPCNCDNLLVAGRCISATHEALAAVRVQHICMAMGQAAGTAAAMCVESGIKPSELDVTALKSLLTEQGAILE